MKNLKKSFLVIGSLGAAIAASACCTIPFLLFTLGISGAWIGNLTALHPYKPWFVLLALGFLIGGFIKIYFKPKAACTTGSYCANPSSDRFIKITLWIAAILIGLALVFPYLLKCFS